LEEAKAFCKNENIKITRSDAEILNGYCAAYQVFAWRLQEELPLYQHQKSIQDAQDYSIAVERPTKQHQGSVTAFWSRSPGTATNSEWLLVDSPHSFSHKSDAQRGFKIVKYSENPYYIDENILDELDDTWIKQESLKKPVSSRLGVYFLKRN